MSKIDKIKIEDKDLSKEDVQTKTNFLKVGINTLKSIFLIILLLTWTSIPIIIMMALGFDYYSLSKIHKIIYLLICDIILIAFLIYIYRKDVIRDFKNFFDKNILKNLKIAVIYWIIGMIVMLASNMLINLVNPGATSVNEDEVRNLINIAPWFMLFELVIYAPLTEELIFRRSFKDITKNKYVYALLSGLVFGGMHIITTVEAPIDLLFIIPYGGLGIAFALLYYKTDNIFSSISVHAMHNGLSLVLYLFF